MAAARLWAGLLVLLALGGDLGALAARVPGSRDAPAHAELQKKHKKKRHPYTSPSNLFIQERASKQLPDAGQHFSFGAVKPWEEILGMLEGRPNRKLLLVVRHGQAVSNYLSEVLGPDEWYAVEGTCEYDAGNGTKYQVFDADLTQLGVDQAKGLNAMLKGAGWYKKLTGGKPVRRIVSPLTRCLHTSSLVMDGLDINATNVEEFVRETIGSDTCDARRSVSDPDHNNRKHKGPCPFEHGLRSKFPDYKFRVVEEDRHSSSDSGGGSNRPTRPLGLISDEDTLWTKDKRERQHHQVRRAKKFLDIMYEHVDEQVAFIITHSGFTRSLLLAVRREPYRPQNTELVPVIVDKTDDRDDPDYDDDDDDDGDDNVWELEDEDNADEDDKQQSDGEDEGDDHDEQQTARWWGSEAQHAGQAGLSLMQRVQQGVSGFGQKLRWATGKVDGVAAA